MSDPAALQEAPKFTSRFMQVGGAEVCKLPPPPPRATHIAMHLAKCSRLQTAIQARDKPMQACSQVSSLLAVGLVNGSCSTLWIREV